MTNPFPGVDPYVEAQGLWPDFHAKFLNYLQEALGDRLPDSYEARIDERVRLLDVEAGTERRIRPDVAVLRGDGGASAAVREVGGVAVLEPEEIPAVILDEDRETFLKVLRRSDKELVAVVELLSPANKAGGGRWEYLARRNAILREDDVHLVEIDLLVGGERPPMARPMPRGEFFASVARAGRRPVCDVYAWGLGDRLPAVPVPLRAPDADVVVDLAPVYAVTYERGRYARSIDRGRGLDLPLEAERRAWAEGVGRGERR